MEVATRLIASPTFPSLPVSPTPHFFSYCISLCSCFPFHCLLHCSITLLLCPALVHTHTTHMKVLRVLLKIQAPNVNPQDPILTHLQNPRKSNFCTRLLSPRLCLCKGKVHRVHNPLPVQSQDKSPKSTNKSKVKTDGQL